jgi:hypothetical protein
MSGEALAWSFAAVATLTGGALAMVTRRDRLWLPLVALGAGLIGIVAGLGWRAWAAAAWSAANIAEALAMLAGGALIVTAWAAPRWADPTDESADERSAALGWALLGTATLVLGAAILAWRDALPTAAPPARSWLYGLRGVVASIGLGGWLPVLTGSAWGLWLANRRGALPSAAADRGRMVALFSYPWLTSALLIAVVWNLAARATIMTAVPGELWPVVAWLLGASYLHATSSWRPRRVAAWLATLLAGLALSAAVFAALSVMTLT